MRIQKMTFLCLAAPWRLPAADRPGDGQGPARAAELLHRYGLVDPSPCPELYPEHGVMSLPGTVIYRRLRHTTTGDPCGQADTLVTANNTGCQSDADHPLRRRLGDRRGRRRRVPRRIGRFNQEHEGQQLHPPGQRPPQAADDLRRREEGEQPGACRASSASACWTRQGGDASVTNCGNYSANQSVREIETFKFKTARSRRASISTRVQVIGFRRAASLRQRCELQQVGGVGQRSLRCRRDRRGADEEVTFGDGWINSGQDSCTTRHRRRTVLLLGCPWSRSERARTPEIAWTTGGGRGAAGRPFCPSDLSDAGASRTAWANSFTVA